MHLLIAASDVFGLLGLLENGGLWIESIYSYYKVLGRRVMSGLVLDIDYY